MRLLRYIIIILFLIIMSCAVTSCKHKGYERRKKIPEIPTSQTTHGHMDEMEQYVYDRIGDGVFFASPLFGPDDPKLITIYIDRNEDETDIGVFDKARCLINEYLKLNPDSFLNNGYKLRLIYATISHNEENKAVITQVGAAFNYLVSPTDQEIENTYPTLFEGLDVVIFSAYYNCYDQIDTDSLSCIDISLMDVDYEKLINIVNTFPEIDYLRVTGLPGEEYKWLQAINEVNPDLTVITE